MVGILCHYHLARSGEQVLASHIVEGEVLCRLCFRGVPIFRTLETSADPPRRTRRTLSPARRARLLEVPQKNAVLHMLRERGARGATTHELGGVNRAKRKIHFLRGKGFDIRVRPGAGLGRHARLYVLDDEPVI